jgi:hypothetical protein
MPPQKKQFAGFINAFAELCASAQEPGFAK